MAALARWWVLLRPPLLGLVAAVLIAIGGAVVVGHSLVWRHTIGQRGAQDFGIFLTSVRHSVQGRSLYTPTRLRSRTARRFATGPPNLNLPHTLVPLLPLAYLSPRAALGVWLAASLVALVWCATAAIRVLASRPHWLAALATVVFLLAWAPSAAFSLTAQVSFLVAWPACLAWLAYRRGHGARAGAWLGLAIAIKPFIGLLVPYLVVRRDWRALGACAATGAGAVLVGAAVFGPGAYVEWLRQLPQVSWAGHYLNASWFAVVVRALGESSLAPLARWEAAVWPTSIAGAMAVGAVTLARLWPRPSSSAGIDRDWACLLLAALLMSPLGWCYYLWIPLWPLVALIVARAPWRAPAWGDLWLLPGLGGWLWWGQMTAWGQPSPVATVTFGSAYFWALLSLWIWTLSPARPG